MDETAVKTKKGQKLFSRKLSLGKKDVPKQIDKNEQALSQDGIEDSAKEVLDGGAASIKSGRKSGGFASLRGPRMSFSKSGNSNKVTAEGQVSGGSRSQSRADSNRDLKPEEVAPIKSRQSSKKADLTRRSNSYSKQSGKGSLQRTASNISEARNQSSSATYPLTQHKEKEEQEIKKKQLASAKSKKQQGKQMKEGQSQSGEKSSNGIPTEELYPWKKIGSFHHTGKGNPETGNARLVKAYILENFVNDWYYNVAIVVGTCFTSWLFAYLRFSWWSLLFILACMGTVFASENRRFNRNVRDDLKRIGVEETLSGRKETTWWFDSFFSKFWVLYMPVLSQQVKDSVNPSLAGSVPGYGIDALTLDEFTLGSKAPAIKCISTDTKAGSDLSDVVFELAFTPSDVSDMTPKEAENKINPKIVLAVSLGKGVVSKKMKIIMEDINISCKLRAMIRFGNTFPNISLIQLQMLEPPIIEFSLKPLGGDTLGLDVMSFLPGLKGFVQSSINSTLGPTYYAPNHYDINMEELMASTVNDAIGVLAITIADGNGLKGSDFITNTVDPYIAFELEKPLPDAIHDLRTDIKPDTTAPRWNETKYILISSLEQTMRMKCFDFNDVRKDAFIGEIKVDLEDLLQEPIQENLRTDLTLGTKSRGTINYSLRWFPVKATQDTTAEAEPKSDAEAKDKQEQETADGTATDDESPTNRKANKKKSIDDEEDEEENASDEEEEEEDGDSGIVKLTLQNIKYLSTLHTVTGTLSPSAALILDGTVVKQFRTLKRINEPSWGETVELFIPSRGESEVKLQIYDNGLREKQLICEYSSTVDEMFKTLQDGPGFVKGAPQGEIFVDAEWKPIKLSGSLAIGGPSEPIGALRVFVRDINVLDDLPGAGDIDPYFDLVINRRVDYKSISYSEKKHAYFDKVVYLSLMSEKASVTINVFDYQSVGKDRFVGSAQIPIGEIIKKDSGTDKYIFVDNSKKPLKLCLQRGGKTRRDYVNVSLSFVPCVPVYTSDEYEMILKKDAEIQKSKKEFWEKQAELKKKMEERPDLYETITEEDPFEEEERKLHKKVPLSLDQLLEHNSGVLNLQLLGGTISQHSVFLQIYVDDLFWPKYISPKIYDGVVSKDDTNLFIRDLRNSKLLFRLSKKRHPKNEKHILAEFSCDTYELFQNGYDKGAKINIGTSVIDFQCLYAPTAQSLPTSDTVLDTGILNLTVISAHNLMPADRSGYSDPFFTIVVDNIQLYKSAIVKKNLSPEWDETMEVPVPSRTRKKIQVFFYDWDRAGDNDPLGFVELDLFSMIPKEVYNWELALNTRGTAKFQASFIPQYNKPGISPTELKKKGTMGRLISAPSNFGHAGKGLVHGSSSIFSKPFKHERNKRRSADSKRRSTAEESADLISPETNPGLADAKKSLDMDRSAPNLDYAVVQELDPESHLPVGEDLSSRIGSQVPSVLSGPVEVSSVDKEKNNGLHRELKPDTNYRGQLTLVAADRVAPKIQLKVGLSLDGKLKHLYKSKSQKEDEGGNVALNETFAFKGPPMGALIFEAFSHHRLTKDEKIGTAEIPLNDPQIEIGGNISLRLAEGTLVIRVEYGTPIKEQGPPASSPV